MSNLSRLYDVEISPEIEQHAANRAVPTVVEPESPKRSLAELLTLMREAEDDLETTEVDLEGLGVDVREKVDSIATYLEICDEKANALRSRMKTIEKKAKAFENRAKTLRSHVAELMAQEALRHETQNGETHATTSLSGEEYKMSLQYHDYVEVLEDPNPVAFLKLGPRFVERRYAWNKRALKLALENQSALVSEYAELKKRPHVKIAIKS